jgi:hypothetical protein
MVRLILGIIAGLIAAVITVALVEALGHMIYPPPAGVDISDPEQLSAIMSTIPLGAKIAVLVAWAIGIVVGSAVAIIIGRKTWPAWVVGGAVLLMGAITMYMIPHPLWMIIATPLTTVLAVILSIRLFGGKAA